MSEINSDIMTPRLSPESYYSDEMLLMGLRLTAGEFQVDPELGLVRERSWQARSIKDEAQDVLFPDETVNFNLCYSNVVNYKGEEMHTRSELVRIPLSDIHDIEDEKLKSLLFEKYLQNKDEDAHSNTYITVNVTNGSVYAVGVPRVLLGVQFTTDGPIENSDYPDYLRHKAEQKLLAYDALPRRHKIVQKFKGWLK